MDYYDYLKSPEWQTIRLRSFKILGKFCEICKASNTVLHIHHLHYDNLGKEKTRDLQVLCESCHKIEHELRAIETFRDKKSLLDYIQSENLSDEEIKLRFPRVRLGRSRATWKVQKTKRQPMQQWMIDMRRAA